MRAQAATVVDIAALMGVSPATIRMWAKKHGIKPTGTAWKAKLYDPKDFLRVSGAHERKLRKGWKPVC